MFKPVPVGKRTRYSYAKIKEVMDMPHLLDIQRNSYEWFMKDGLKEIFHDISPIQDFTGNLVLSFENFSLGDPKYSIDECKERDTTYAAPLRVNVRLINNETGEIKEQEVFMGDFPLMTETGTFIINGAERVIVSQLVRSPGAYYGVTTDPTGKQLYSSTLIPNRGAWIELENDANDVVSVRIDRTRKLPVTILIRALGISSNQAIAELFDNDPRIVNTMERDSAVSKEEALVEIYKRLRPGEPPTIENSQALLDGLFFDPKRYDLATVGRYKITKKLGWKRRLVGHELIEPLVDHTTGEIVVPANTIVDMVMLDPITVEQEKNIFGDGEMITFYVKGKTDKPMKMICSPTLEYHHRTITIEDIMASINYLLNLMDGVGNTDDIDHLGNRRVRSVGELLQNQFRIGLSRMERVVRERMTIQDNEVITPQALINIRPVVAAIKEFFGSSQLSQFMDQHNPLSELTHKRRLSALGPGGLSRERAGFEVRDVHNSHYGRMCPIETPEGPNIGLIGSLSTYARVNRFGFMETPYRKVDKAHKKVTNEVYYLTADEEEDIVIAQANEKLDENDWFVASRVTARFHEETNLMPADSVDYMDVSPKQVVSIATAMIPFLENDDANRALMGANMQRQAVPLLRTQAPLVGTGMEYKAACDSGVMILARNAGTIAKVTADQIVVRKENGECDRYKLQKYLRSNQGTCINQVPIVYKGDSVYKGQPIADGPATDHGELALGYNIIVAFMPWEGYNYEDAVLLSEKLVKEDIYTSIHIEEYECDARDTKLGAEEITRDMPNVAEEALKDLDEKGIIRIGAEVRPGDILVGKVTPKGETELTAEERLLRAIFGEKAREVRDTSLRVPHGEAGKIVDVKIFSRENNDELPPGVNQLVRVYIAQKRKIAVGDKMAGRHGNKGVVSRVMREEDMPFLPDGTPVNIVLNPLGVPSRMNIGQVLETHLGMAVRELGMQIKAGDITVEKRLRDIGYDFDAYGMPKPDAAGLHIATPVFDGAKENEVFETLHASGFSDDGKTILYDGRTGEPFENPVTVGCVYMLKLHHLVDDKIHARSTGPYSLVTQQPLGGKAQFGGQRFGEMEVWALEAYGAAYTLQEILTVKSDDVVGRVKTYESIVKGENIPEPGVPESFKVLIKELQSIGLDIKILSEDAQEIMIHDTDDDIVDAPNENAGIPNPPPAKEHDNKPAVAADSPKTDDDAVDDDDIIAELGNMTNEEDPEANNQNSSSNDDMDTNDDYNE
ncbi:DNA-directed RNA polymerase subunit beta [Pectinatus cerevisiiphilus]|uniref:DNA-directed RNA polymerase subunit beta n=1 Tax=Pectinatus cerevisiiphilus TaxID=86956 RepID=A0A4R3KD12_9FIRM|nr:DNA-directed RNA polymerase subunit beta [Pectinatus cerevisiiphilus]TCS81017.1 DNA-directed RNA polymerase subunit beta [Pectinatus cerevisiiphilus]